MWKDNFWFDLTDEEKLIQQTARDFADGELKPIAAKLDQEHLFPESQIKKLAELGFLGAVIPQDFGGIGCSTVAYCLAIEELSAGCASTGIIVSAHNSLCAAPVVKFGTKEQKEKFLPTLASGETLGCFALSEPGTGSDAANQICSVKKENDSFIINGTKNWITNAPKAGLCVLFSMQDPKLGNKGITSFVHEMKTDGVSVGKKEEKLGICASPTASISYSNCKLSAINLLNPECAGFKVAMSTLDGGRLGVASQAIGIARAALESALSYTKERKTFGKFLHEHQSIQNYLADMIMEIDAARYLNLGAARLKDAGRDYSRQAAQAKLFASEAAVKVTNLALQIFGGYGFVKDYPLERHYRDARITTIYEGTSEIQRLVIAGNLLKE